MIFITVKMCPKKWPKIDYLNPIKPCKTEK